LAVAADFRTDLAFADERRLRLEANFYAKYCRDNRFVSLERSDGSLYIQKHCHIDCVVASRAGGSLTVEEKIVRWKGRAYTAIVVETHSNLERTSDEPIGDGWIKTSVADCLLYAFEQEDGSLRVWLFDLPKLRGWFMQNFERFAVTDKRNDFYTTRCRVVPLDQIPSDCVRAQDKAA